jgi:phosphatidylglycerol:prolipoprotein diacylglycerol transferase
MIPYFKFTFIPIGPLHIQVWGFFVAAGILVAAWLGARKARERGLDGDVFLDFASWIVIAALVGGRVFHVLAYEPASYLADPWRVLRVWEGGMSSFGGFAGAAVAALLFARIKRIDFFAYADPAVFALPLGYSIGRLGCFFIHDHPGTLSHFLLAVRFPGGERLDHGLLLSLLGFAIFAWFLAIERRGEGRKGFLFLFMVSYGAARFFLDFFRAWDLPGADTRYLMLTPAQYGSLLILAVGAWFLKKTTVAKSA